MQRMFLTLLILSTTITFFPKLILSQKRIQIESVMNPSLFWKVDTTKDSAIYLRSPSSTEDPSLFQFIQYPNIGHRHAPLPIQFLLRILPPNPIVSFASVAQPRHYLRHFSNRLRLDPYSENPIYLSDAAFKLRPALNSAPDCLSFESVNVPRSYLKQDNDLGIILSPFDPYDPEIDPRPYTFKIHSLPTTNTTTPTTTPPTPTPTTP